MSKKYLAAFLLVALFTTASVSANTVFKKLTATERPDYNLVVNGNSVELKNNPVTIDGVTYLPLREVATILNQDVGFDKGTISLESKPTDTTIIVESNTIKDNSKELKNVQDVAENEQTINLDDYIGLRDLATSTGAYVTLGPTDENQNTLRIEKDDIKIDIYDLTAISSETVKTLSTNKGKSVKIYVYRGTSYIERAFLVSEGILN